LHAEQSKLTLVTQAVESLIAKQIELKSELEKAIYNESQAEIMNRLKSIAVKPKKHFQAARKYDWSLTRLLANLQKACLKHPKDLVQTRRILGES
jgi:hypothetical protein